MTEEIKGQLRHGLTAIGGALASAGVINTGYVELGVGVAMALIGFIWSWMAKKQ